MSQPLTDQQLADIGRRIPTGYNGPWTVDQAENGRDWVIAYPTSNPLAGLVATVPDYGYYLAEFLAAAREDVPALLAEVDRLRAERDQARAQLLHFAAEAHRRKWAYDNGDEQPPSHAFAELHRLGNELHAALNTTARES